MMLLCAACSEDGETTRIYVPEEIEFAISDPTGVVYDGMEVAVAAECLRDGAQVSMTGERCSKYIVTVSSTGIKLSPATAADRIYARYGDTGLRYTVFCPYSEEVISDVSVPETQTYGQELPSAVYGTAAMEQVVKTVLVQVSERPLCSVLALELPADLIAEKTVVLSELSVLGVTMDFGGGLSLDENRVVRVAVAPFTVPSGGISVGFTTVEGETFASTILSGSADAGLSVSIGAELQAYVPSADPFRPCTFPVVFPLGKNPSARTGYYNYSDDQPEWNNQGIWRCFAQKQVYATWNQVSEPAEGLYQRRELINTGDIGSIGVKGIWTGDYFEFVLPVDHIDAGSIVSFEAPFYGRQQPVFWTVEWLDGGEWKQDVRDVSAWDGTEARASFSTRLYGCVITYRFRLENPLDREYLRVRIVCADGSCQADTQTNTVIRRELPYNDGQSYQAPFYFYCEGSGVDGFTWDIAPGSDGPESGSTEDLIVRDQIWEWED